MPKDTLGKLLRQVRTMRARSLKSVADEANMSPAYLQKLESDEVQEPSPRILFRLAQALDVPYADLMQASGYVVPKPAKNPGTNLLAQALSSAELSLDELEALAQYLAWYRHSKKR